MDNKVYVYKYDKMGYPGNDYNFRPSARYPECIFDDISPIKNKVYEGIRELFRLADLDSGNFGTKNWNPLKEIIKCGDNVVIKPNLVYQENKSGYGLDCLITHPSVVAAVIDYVVLAIGRQGSIIVGDAPVQECDFENLIQESGYASLIEYYTKKGINVKLVDFRALKTTIVGGYREQHIDESVKGCIVDLADESEFSDLSEDILNRLRITNYDPEELKQHHTMVKHEYSVARDVLNADVIINMPKPKTHRKAGVTISLKNCIGVCTRKECLPHHTVGDCMSGGDGYSKHNIYREKYDHLLDEFNALIPKHRKIQLFFMRFRMHFLRKKFCNYDEIHADGSWKGNNTISKTIIDVNKIVNNCNSNGSMCKSRQRKMLVIADMIITGQGEGPLSPEPRESNALAMGYNQLLFDEAIASIFFGVSIDDIPVLVLGRNSKSSYKLIDDDAKPFIVSNITEWNGRRLYEIVDTCKMSVKAPGGWKDIFSHD